VRRLVEFHLAAAMTEEPAPGVMGLINGDPVNPCLQTALPAEIADIAEDFEEYLLNYVAGFPLIIEQPYRESIHRVLETLNHPFVGALRPVAEGFHQVEILQIDSVSRPFRVQFEDGRRHRQPHISPDFTLPGKSSPCKSIDTGCRAKVPGRNP